MSGSVQISNHLDEIDAPAWPFINDEAAKVGGKTGHIDNYRYEQACGGVVVLWDGFHYDDLDTEHQVEADEPLFEVVFNALRADFASGQLPACGLGAEVSCSTIEGAN